MPSQYTFQPYSPEWPLEFEAEVARLKALLGDEVVTAHHIGSTAVPGLAAKNVIDLLPEVRSIARIDELTPVLEAAGYKPWGEYGLAGRRYFTKDRGDYRTHNVHIYQSGPEGSPAEIERHLAFRDYLRTHDRERAEYEAIKRAIFPTLNHDISAYNDAKDAWVKRTEKIALEWYRQQK